MDKFSQEEIDKYINMVAILAEKPVLGLLREMIIDQLKTEQAQLLISDLDEIQKQQGCGFVSIEFNMEQRKFELCTCLTLSDKTYVPNTLVPDSDIANKLYENYDKLKQTAIGYWRGFLVKYPEFVNKLKTLMPYINFDSLVIGEDNATSLYFDADFKKRIGLYAYYKMDGELYYMPEK